MGVSPKVCIIVNWVLIAVGLVAALTIKCLVSGLFEGTTNKESPDVSASVQDSHNIKL